MTRSLTLSMALTLALAAPAQARDLDQELLRAANTAGAPALDWPMGVASHAGFLFGAPIALGYAAAPGYELPLLVAGAEVVSGGASLLVKAIAQRPRPYETLTDLNIPTGPVPLDPNSFPSGHAAVSFAAATVIADWNPAYALPAYGLAALISYSRLYNGVHYPSDVLVGAALGYGSGKLTRWGYDQWRARNPQGPLPAAPLSFGWTTRF